MENDASKLPARPNLDHLRAQAKTSPRRPARRQSSTAARTFIEHLPAAKDMTPIACGARACGSRTRSRRSRRKSGFASWPSLARHVEHLRRTRRSVGVRRPSKSTATEDGRQPMLGDSTLLIDGDRFRMTVARGRRTKASSASTSRPIHLVIDIEFVEGPEAGNWSYGIYELDGDDLTFCLGLTGAPRPTGFATSPNTGHALERLRRVSAARPAGVKAARARLPKPRPRLRSTNRRSR